jgi:signal transduction histidine kinase
MTIRGRLTRAFVWIAILIAFGAVITVWQFNRVVDETQYILKIDNRLSEVQKLERTVGTLSRRLAVDVEPHDPSRLIEATRQARATITTELNAAAAAFADSQAVFPSTLRVSIFGVYDQLDAIERLARANGWLAIRLRLEIQLNDMLSAISESVGKSTVEVAAERRQALEEVEFRRHMAQLILAITASACLVASLWLGYNVTRSITRPLQALKEAARQLAANDFDLRLEITTEDELADVGRNVLAAARALEMSYAALQHSNNDLEQFARAASHDLREPLRTISVVSGLLKRNHSSRLNPDDVEHLNTISAAAARMNELINGILSYSLLAHSQGLEREEVDAQEVVNAVVNNLQTMIGETYAKVTALNLPKLHVIRVQLIQIFQNLISNAIKYRRKDRVPHIIITAEPRPDRWIFCVADNGIGIPAKYHLRIFEAFRQIDPKQAGGVGLGLATTKRIVEQQGGEIWVESDGIDGSRFYFSIRQPAITTPSLSANEQNDIVSPR